MVPSSFASACRGIHAYVYVPLSTVLSLSSSSFSTGHHLPVPGSVHTTQWSLRWPMMSLSTRGVSALFSSVIRERDHRCPYGDGVQQGRQRWSCDVCTVGNGNKPATAAVVVLMGKATSHLNEYTRYEASELTSGRRLTRGAQRCSPPDAPLTASNAPFSFLQRGLVPNELSTSNKLTKRRNL